MECSIHSARTVSGVEFILDVGWLCVIPFLLVWDCVVAVFVFANDYLNPIREWFAAKLTGPKVKLVGGVFPVYKPFNKWDNAPGRKQD